MLQGPIRTFDVGLEELKNIDEIECVGQETQNVEQEIDSFASSEEEEQALERDMITETKNKVVSVMMESVPNFPKSPRGERSVIGSRPNWGDSELFSAPEAHFPVEEQSTSQQDTTKKNTNTLTKKIKTGVQEIVEKAKSIITPADDTNEYPSQPSTSRVFSSKKGKSRLEDQPVEVGRGKSKTGKQHDKNVAEEFKRLVEEQIHLDGDVVQVPTKSYEEYQEEEKRGKARKIKGKSIPGKNLQKRQPLPSSFSARAPGTTLPSSTLSNRALPVRPIQDDISTKTREILMSKEGQEIIELSVSKVMIPQMREITSKMEEIITHLKRQDEVIKKLKATSGGSETLVQNEARGAKGKSKREFQDEITFSGMDLFQPLSNPPEHQNKTKTICKLLSSFQSTFTRTF